MIFFLVLLFLVSIFGFIFVKLNLSPASLDSKNKIFVVKEGDGVQLISQNLQTNGFIKNKYVNKMCFLFVILK